LQRTATSVTSIVTFIDKEYPLRSANAGFMPTLVHAVFFGRSLTRIYLQKRNTSVAGLFCAGRTPATPMNADCAEGRGGHGRFAKRRTTGPWRNGHDCLNAATVLDRAARVRDDAPLILQIDHTRRLAVDASGVHCCGVRRVVAGTPSCFASFSLWCFWRS